MVGDLKEIPRLAKVGGNMLRVVSERKASEALNSWTDEVADYLSTFTNHPELAADWLSQPMPTEYSTGNWRRSSFKRAVQSRLNWLSDLPRKIQHKKTMQSLERGFFDTSSAVSSSDTSADPPVITPFIIVTKSRGHAAVSEIVRAFL